MCYDYWKETDGAIVMGLDYSERYQPVPMRENQSENFAKDSDVSMEIQIVSYQEKKWVDQILHQPGWKFHTQHYQMKISRLLPPHFRTQY